jgi:hypothetical protein
LLAAGARARLEPRLGRDFTDIRVHGGAEAAASARAIGEEAYVICSDLVFPCGAYAPSTERGQRFIAHEPPHAAQGEAESLVRRQPERDAGAAPPAAGEHKQSYALLAEG